MIPAIQKNSRFILAIKLSLPIPYSFSDSHYVVDDTAINPVDVLEKCRLIKSKHNDLGLILIDYVQLMKASEKTSSHQEAMASIMGTLKEIALELSTPVIVFAQLSRFSEMADSTNRPQLSQLRGIESFADKVLFVYRESLYMNKTDDRYEQASKRGEICIVKQKSGLLTDISVSWSQQYSRFDNLETTTVE